MGSTTGTPDSPRLDVLVVGAGFAGLYLLHKLRQLAFSTRVLEAADDVGGTWYWNRYPGARCDIPTTDYTFGFDPELERAWTWSEKYATQPEILAYARFVAERYDLRRDIDFGTHVQSAHWDSATEHWTVTTSAGASYHCRYFIMASGCLSVPKVPDVPGRERFRGDVYFTSRWPHTAVDFTGKKVAVIGTGSSGIQAVPLIARQAEHLTVFQRTANFSWPAHNGEHDPARLAALATDRDAYRTAAKYSRIGVPCTPTDVLGTYATPEVQRERFESAWNEGGLVAFSNVFADLLFNADSNELVAEMTREKIRSIVEDPKTAATLCPSGYPIGSKRLCVDTDYYTTFNRPNVQLVDLQTTPITTITEDGITVGEESLAFDAIVFATGFDALTGALVAVNIEGCDGLSLQQKWADGPHTYLGLMTTGFPNLFTVTGPGSPSVLSNMMVSIEQHVEWIAQCLDALRADGMTCIEPTETAEAGWVSHVADGAKLSLYPQADSWYMGANVPGKPRVFLAYAGGVEFYRNVCDEVVQRNYLGFRRSGPHGVSCEDGIIRQLQLDVETVVNLVNSLGLPPLESLPVDQARDLMKMMEVGRPSGPAVGEILDGTLPGATGELSYRLYRPEGPGPHPIVVYFHGGGWVLGSQQSDDPLCRDLCKRSNTLWISVDYRHAPEAPFPAAIDDGLAAVRWVDQQAAALGGRPNALAVAGWSAGGNIATVLCRRLRDQGGPGIRGQLLLTPVVDYDMTRASYTENAEGYLLTADVMRWFWDHYAAPDERASPDISPLRAADLSGLPAACIVTCQFDPLRDEGNAYAAALTQAGVPTELIVAPGHIHSSLTMVDAVVSGSAYREQMANAVKGFFS